MKKYYLFLIFSLLAICSFIPKDAEAIDNDCKNSNLYSALININPVHGDIGSSFAVEMKFKWNQGTPQKCLDTNLRFDLSYSTSNGKSGNIGEYPFGKAGTATYTTKSYTDSVRPDFNYSSGDTITFSLKIEDDDGIDAGEDLFSTPEVAIFTVRTEETNNYACVIGEHYKCSPGNKNDCSDITAPSCGQSPCAIIKKEKCNQPVPGVCGNGIVETIEQCDGSNLNEKSCLSLGQGFTGGTLKCNAQCGFDTSQCTGGSGGGTTNCGGTGQPACPTGQTTTYPFEVPNPLQGGANTVAELVSIIVKWIFSIAIPIAVAVIVYSGILFLTSKGNPAQVTKARDMLKYAVIGLAIIMIGSGFISLIKSILELGAGPAS